MSDSSKFYGENGVHRVPLWRIAGFALNNTATNLYMFTMNFVAYYLAGWVGVGTVVAGSFSMMMRIWDGVTDPFVGFMVDKTNGKFGKNRPFMVVGNVILLVTSYILFHVTHTLPMGARFPFFIVVSAIYYLGYTAQCVVTKSAQTCLTNDPKQRPLFSTFDGVYNTVLFTGLQVLSTNLAGKYGGFTTDPALFHDLWKVAAIGSAVCTVIAVLSIAPKDKPEFFGTGKPQKITFKDYWDTLKGNRAIQMLVVAASTDKLASQMKSQTVINIVLVGAVMGNYAVNGTLTGITAVPTAIITAIVISTVCPRIGQRKAMIVGTWGGIVTCLLLVLLFIFGNPSSAATEAGLVYGFFTIAYILLNVVLGAFQGLSGNIVIPMTADCADYEVYRTGKYVPGLMGTLFSMVDKLISSFAPMLVSICYSAIGFKDALPDVGVAYSDTLRNMTLFLAFGSLIFGYVCNLIAMKFYPLTKEKMEEIQGEIAAIKAKAMAENN